MRKFNLVDKVWGDYGFFVIRFEGELWEPFWGSLQHSTSWAWMHKGLLPISDRDIWENAMHGYVTPLIRILTTPPAVMLSRCPEAQSQCRQRDACPSYDPKKCVFACKTSPICFDVDEADEHLRLKLQMIRDAWRENRYGLLVPDTYEE